MALSAAASNLSFFFGSPSAAGASWARFILVIEHTCSAGRQRQSFQGISRCCYVDDGVAALAVNKHSCCLLPVCTAKTTRHSGDSSSEAVANNLIRSTDFAKQLIMARAQAFSASSAARTRRVLACKSRTTSHALELSLHRRDAVLAAVSLVVLAPCSAASAGLYAFVKLPQAHVPALSHCTNCVRGLQAHKSQTKEDSSRRVLHPRCIHSLGTAAT